MPVMQNRRMARTNGGIVSFLMLVVLAAGVAALRSADRPAGEGDTLPRMERVLLDDIIHTDYGQFDLVWSDGTGFDGDWDRFFEGQVNGLVGAAPGNGVYINLARRSGGSRVRIVLVDGAPSLPLPSFEDVVEVSVMIPDGATVAWWSWGGEKSGTVPGLEPGTYRMRVSAHGRDAGRQDEFAEEVVDEYLLELWPSSPAPDAILRIGSEDAKYWHREVGGRR
jgi:hypothetical protein